MNKDLLGEITEAFEQADKEWHEKEWEDFIENIRADERERLRALVEVKIRKLELEAGKQDDTNTEAIGKRISELYWVLNLLDDNQE